MSALFAKIMAFLMAVLAFFGIHVGGNGPEPTEANDVVSYAVDGGEIDLFMTSNASTGFSWTYEQDGDSVAFVREEYKNPSDSFPGGVAVAGAPGEQHFYFSAVRPGDTVITFTYSRPWETDGDRTVTSVTVSVAEDLSVSVA